MTLEACLKEIKEFMKLNKVRFGEVKIIIKQGKIFELDMTKKEQK